ncbi:MAG: hypothetical protein J1E63_05505 [Muribaculaceae bacterium]|nr:hypothetical protein [Muribaculaceae bacterium]
MKRPIIIQSKLMPKGICLNLFGTFWARDTRWIDRYVVNHERIHTAQMRELLFIPFYILYGIEYIFRLLRYRNRSAAYRNLSFEREAYTNGNDLTYLSQRRHFAWVNYLRRQK